MANNTARGRNGSSAAKTAQMSVGEAFRQNIAETASEMRGILYDKKHKVNIKLLGLIILLLIVGILMMYSASYVYAYENRGSGEYFLYRQLMYAGVGAVVMFLASIYPPEKFKRWTPWVFALAFVLLIIVLFCDPVNGSRRWIPLGPFGTFQPSELAKFALILFGATWATNNSERMNTFKYGVFPMAMGMAILVLPILMETHLSCSILMVLIAATLMFVGGIDMKWMIAAVSAGTIGLVLIFTGVIPYGQDRIAAFKDPFVDALGSGWQNIQALYAISAGGLFGQGIGQSHQKHLYISEPQNDFVFAVVCEELGFFGAMIIIALFAMLVILGFVISINHSDRFCKLMGIGITAQVGWQVLLNVAVVTKTIPNTGIGLPFFSSGGTAMIMIMAEMGILLAISRTSTIRRI